MNKEGGFSQGGMWKLRNSLVSKCIETPMAKRDWQGNLITDRNMLRQLYLNTYKERLKNQDIKPELLDLYEMKMELWKLRLAESQNKKTKEWEINDLNHVLKSLKRNKSRDPHGLLNDLFKDCLGNDLKLALLALLNEIKKEQKLPKLLQFANITTIWKKKGSRQDLNNDRGIFVVSIIRMILDSLIYRDLFPLIERNMSDSNIGARKERNIRDHLFIVYGIMNSVMHGDEEPVDIQIYDVEKCFDKLWLEDCLLDLYDTLPPEGRNDKLSLLYKMNQENFVSVKTAAGLTDRINLKNIVMQGGKWGPIKCSNTMDHIGKKFQKEDKHLYLYKGCIKVLPLAMIDDLLVIAPCGAKSEEVNIELNAEIDMKKLRFHAPMNGKKSKCHFIHVGKNTLEQHNLKVHGTTMEQVNSDT